MTHPFYSKPVLAYIFLLLSCSPVGAQITPDSSLRNSRSTVVPSQVVNETPSDVISGGAVRGQNLFHSFQDFSVAANRGAYFANPSGVVNILTRITGNSPSNILGVLGVLGNANLFLLNPNGIIFGPNARLVLNGSFLGTTATSIIFSNEIQFSAKNPQNIPLLTINVPIGLGFTDSPGSIQVRGMGHTLYQPPSVAPTPVVGAGLSRTGLRVQPGRDIALVGGNIIFDGGIVTAPAGRVEIGSVGAGQVTLNNLSAGRQWVNYSSVQNFRDIEFTNLSLLDASGPATGNIFLQGNHITLSNGSYALVQSQSQDFSPSGKIIVRAAESLEIRGTNMNPIAGSIPSTAQARAGIISQSFSNQGADIYVFTKDINLQSAGGIISTAVSSGWGGNISINASESVKVASFSPIDPTNSISLISTISAGTARAGNISIATKNLSIVDGGDIGSATYGLGSGGNVLMDASDSTILNGFNRFSLVPSLLNSSTFARGDAGNLIVNTSKLAMIDGARLDSSTLASGKAGGVTINAANSVSLSGTVPNSINPTLIISSANLVDPVLKKILGLSSSVLNGASGNVTINTSNLSIIKGAQITVRNDGTGDAGSLTVKARSIFLDNKGGITAATVSGRGGNILINAQNLQLGNNNLITATAGGSGNGGNISIKTGTLAALENSRISADAVRGKGGNIQINVQGLFQSPDSKFTASSNLGINGTVQVKTLVNNSTLGLVRLPIVPVDAAKLIAQGCGGNAGVRGNKFVVIGSGGLPPGPTEPQTGNTVLADLGSDAAPKSVSSDSSDIENAMPSTEYEYKGGPLIEAQGWVTNSKGEVVLTANPPTLTPDIPWVKPNACHAR